MGHLAPINGKYLKDLAEQKNRVEWKAAIETALPFFVAAAKRGHMSVSHDIDFFTSAFHPDKSANQSADAGPSFNVDRPTLHWLVGYLDKEVGIDLNFDDVDIPRMLYFSWNNAKG